VQQFIDSDTTNKVPGRNASGVWAAAGIPATPLPVIVQSLFEMGDFRLGALRFPGIVVLSFGETVDFFFF
jgi:hypothetical protein